MSGRGDSPRAASAAAATFKKPGTSSNATGKRSPMSLGAAARMKAKASAAKERSKSPMKRDPERFFKWKKPEAGEGPRLNVTAVEKYHRKRRIAELKKEDPAGFKQIWADVEREVMGPTRSSYMDNAHRSMGALILRNCLLRYLDSQKSKLFYRWMSVVCDLPTVHDFVSMRDELKETIEVLGEAQTKVDHLEERETQLQTEVLTGRADAARTSAQIEMMVAQIENKDQRTMFLFIRKMYFKRALRGFATWLTFTDWHRRRERVARRTARVMLRHTHARVMRTWRATIATRKRDRAIRGRAERAARKWSRRLLASAWNAWDLECKEARRLRNLQRRAAGRLMHRKLAAAFSLYHSNVAILVAHRKKMNKVFYRMANGTKLRSLNTWKANVDDIKLNRRRVARALGKIQFRVAAAAFQTWDDLVIEAQQMRQKLNRALAKLCNRRVAVALEAWLDFVRRRKRARDFLVRMVGRWSNKVTSAGWFSWVTHVSTLKRAENDARIRNQRIRNVLMKLKLRRAAAAFHGWEAAVKQAKRNRITVTRSLARMKNRTVARATLRWNDFVERRVFARAFLRKMVGRWENKEIAGGFEAWRAALASMDREIEAERIRQQRMRNVAMKIKMRAAAQGFDGWAAAVEEVKRNRVAVARCLGKMRMRQSAAAFDSWLDLVDRRDCARRFLDKMLGRWQNKAIAGGWASWRNFILQTKSASAAAELEAQLQRAKEQRIRGIVLKIKNRASAQAFDGWAFAVSEIKRNRLVVQRCLAKMRLRSVSVAMRSWVDLVERRAFARAFLGKMVGRWANREVAGGFSSWRHMLLEMDRAKEAERIKQQRMTNVAMKIKMRCSAMAFLSWSTAVVEIKRNRTAVARCLGKMRMRQASAAFEAWIDLLSRRFAARKFLNKMYGRWQNKEIACGWAAWRNFVLLLDHAAEAAELEAQLQRAKEQRARNIVLKMRNRAAAQTFDGWASAVDDIKRNRVAVQRCLAKMQMRSVAAAVNAWVDLVERRVFARAFLRKMVGRWENKEIAGGFEAWRAALASMDREIEAERIRQQRMRNVAMKIKMRAAAQGFDGWAAAVEEVKRNRVAVARCLGKMRMRQSAAAFDSWLDLVDRRDCARRFLDKMLGRWQNKAIAGGWASWRNFILQTKSASAAAELEAQLQRAKEQRIRGIVLKIKNRASAQAFDGWAFAVSEIKRNRLVVQRCLAKMRLRAAAVSFSSWVDLVERRSFARRFLCKMVGRWKNKELAGSVQKWRYIVIEAQRAEEAKRIKQQRMRNIVLKIRMRGTAQAFDGWASAVDVIKRNRVSVARCVAKMHMRVAAAALQTWADETFVAKRNRFAVERCLAKMKLRRVWMSIEEWRDLVDRRTTARRFLKKVVSRLQNKEIARGYQLWRVFVLAQKRAEQQEREQNARMRNILLRIKYRAASESFHGWAAAAVTARQNRIAVSRCLAKIRHKASAQAFSTWVDLVYRRVAARRFCRKMYFHWKAERLGKSFVQWHMHLGEEAQRMHAARLEAEITRAKEQRQRFLHKKILLKSAASALSRWIDFVTEVKFNRTVVQRCIAKIAMRATTAAFQSWLTMVQERKQNRVKISRCLMKIRNRVILSAYRAMVDLAKRRRKSRKFLNKMVGRWKNKQIAGGFASWRAFSQDVYRAQNRKQLLQKRLINISLKIYHRAKAIAFDGWKDAVETRLRNRTAVQRSLRRIKRRLVLVAYESWIDLVERRDIARGFLRKMLFRWRGRLLVHSFGIWRDQTWDFKGAAAQREEFDAMLRAERDRAASAKREFDAALERETNASGALIQEFEEALQRKRDQHERLQQQRLAFVTGKVRNRTAAKAFTTWCDAYRAASRERGLLLKAMARLSKKRLLVRFEDWVVMAEQRMAARAFLLRMYVRWQRGGMQRGFSQWKLYTLLEHQRLSAGEVNQQALAEVDRILSIQQAQLDRQKAERQRKILGRMAQRKQALAFAAWTVVLIRRRKKKRALLRLENRQLSLAFGTWIDLTDRRMWLRSLLLRLLSQWGAKKKLDAWRKWRAVVWYEAMLTGSDEAKRTMAQKSAVRRLLRRLSHSAKRQVFVKWNSYLLMDAHLARVGRRIARVMHQALHSHFEAWAIETRRVKALESAQRRQQIVNLERARRCAGKVWFRTKKAALDRWLDGVLVVRSQRARVANALRRGQRRGLCECVNIWLDFVDRRRRARSLFLIYIETRKWRLELRRGFGTWRASAAAMAPARVEGDVCKMCNRPKYGIFRPVKVGGGWDLNPRDRQGRVVVSVLQHKQRHPRRAASPPPCPPRRPKTAAPVHSVSRHVNKTRRGDGAVPKTPDKMKPKRGTEDETVSGIRNNAKVDSMRKASPLPELSKDTEVIEVQPHNERSGVAEAAKNFASKVAAAFAATAPPYKDDGEVYRIGSRHFLSRYRPASSYNASTPSTMNETQGSTINLDDLSFATATSTNSEWRNVLHNHAIRPVTVHVNSPRMHQPVKPYYPYEPQQLRSARAKRSAVSARTQGTNPAVASHSTKPRHKRKRDAAGPSRNGERQKMSSPRMVERPSTQKSRNSRRPQHDNLRQKRQNAKVHDIRGNNPVDERYTKSGVKGGAPSAMGTRFGQARARPQHASPYNASAYNVERQVNEASIRETTGSAWGLGVCDPRTGREGVPNGNHGGPHRLRWERTSESAVPAELSMPTTSTVGIFEELPTENLHFGSPSASFANECDDDSVNGFLSAEDVAEEVPH